MPEMANLCKWKFTNLDEEKQFELVALIDQENPGINLRVSNNLERHLILHPKDKAAEEVLRETAKEEPELTQLDPEKKVSRIVLMHYPLNYSMHPILLITGVIRAERCTAGINKSPTKQVIVTVVGKLCTCTSWPLGSWGTFQARPYKPAPLRCYKCQRFGHHQARCTSSPRCGICSKPHETEDCIKRHKEGATTTPRCPNCRASHHAWHPQCPARLQKITASQKNPEDTTKPAPPPKNPAWTSGPPAWTANKPAAEIITFTTETLTKLLTTVVELARQPNLDTKEIIETAVKEAVKKPQDEDWPDIPKDQRIQKQQRPKKTPRKRLKLEAPLRINPDAEKSPAQLRSQEIPDNQEAEVTNSSPPETSMETLTSCENFKKFDEIMKYRPPYWKVQTTTATPPNSTQHHGEASSPFLPTQLHHHSSTLAS